MTKLCDGKECDFILDFALLQLMYLHKCIIHTHWKVGPARVLKHTSEFHL